MDTDHILGLDNSIRPVINEKLCHWLDRKHNLTCMQDLLQLKMRSVPEIATTVIDPM